MMLDDAATISLQRISTISNRSILATYAKYDNGDAFNRHNIICECNMLHSQICSTEMKTFYNEVSLPVEENPICCSIRVFSYFGIPDNFLQFLSCVRCQNSDNNGKTHVCVCACVCAL